MTESYQFLIDGIIPSTQEGHKRDTLNETVRRKESAAVANFKNLMKKQFEIDKLPNYFPTSNQVFVAIIQFFTSTKKDYISRDVDNMAKTILDVLEKNNFYKTDSQVRTLLVSKRVDLLKVPQNLAYIYIEVLKDGEDKTEVNSLVENALTLYRDFKASNVQTS